MFLKQGYVAPGLKSSLQNFYGRHNKPVIVTKHQFLTWEWIFSFLHRFFFPLSREDFYRAWLGVTRRMSCKKQNSLSLASTWGHSRFLVWPVSLVVLGFGVVPFALLYVLQQIWTVSLGCLFLIAIFLITKMVKFLHDHSHQFPLDGHKRRKLTS